MRQRKPLNEKRLTKKQVQEIVSTKGRLHEVYTNFFQKEIPIKNEGNLVYELPDDQFLFVYGESSMSVPGKGDIFSKDSIEKWIKRLKRTNEDNANNRSSSFSHWKFYSKYKSDILNHIDDLINELANVLFIDKSKLDKTYQSLDLISSACKKHDVEFIFKNLYDNLVIYIGEVIKKRVGGHWEINKIFSGGDYPFVSVGLKNVQYSAINAFWTALDDEDSIDFRKEAANIVRQESSRVKFERHIEKMNLNNG